jgi:uncharacterized cupin superfamily protein
VSAPLSFFAPELLAAKGRRASVLAGDPHDSTRPLVKGLAGGASVGSWACTAGAWDSPAPRTSTEFFYVLSGNGCLPPPSPLQLCPGESCLSVEPGSSPSTLDVGVSFVFTPN